MRIHIEGLREWIKKLMVWQVKSITAQRLTVSAKIISYHSTMRPEFCDKNKGCVSPKFKIIFRMKKGKRFGEFDV